MANIPRPFLNRIPGGGMPTAKQDNHIKDLSKLTRVDLREIKERQEKLLANKTKLKQLPDKGKRIQDFYDKVLAEMECRVNVDEAAAMFSELNIAAKGHKTLNELEWSGRLNNEVDPSEDVLDSDDEIELDPLRIIAQRTMHERRVKILPPEPLLITDEDLAEIKTFKAGSNDSGLSIESECVASSASAASTDCEHSMTKDNISHKRIFDTPATDLDQHVHYLVEKTETSLSHTPQREKFKPYKTTVSNVHDPDKERVRKQGKHWEVTAATPPLIQHNSTQLITLLDSVEIQTNYLAKLKNLQEQQAAERLVMKLQRLEHKMQLPTTEQLKSNAAFTNYRATVAADHIEGDPRYNEAEEVHDPLDVEKPGGGITYTIYE